MSAKSNGLHLSDLLFPPSLLSDGVYSAPDWVESTAATQATLSYVVVVAPDAAVWLLAVGYRRAWVVSRPLLMELERRSERPG